MLKLPDSYFWKGNFELPQFIGDSAKRHPLLGRFLVISGIDSVNLIYTHYSLLTDCKSKVLSVAYTCICCFRSSAVDLYQLGETCTVYNDKSETAIFYPILPSGISYDLKSKNLTFRSSPHTNKITLSVGTLCPSGALCETAPQTFLWNTHYPSGILGPFVVYDNQIYYILETFPTSNNTDNSSTLERRIIELYFMEDCQSRFPLHNTSIDLTQCSRNLSVILDEPYSGNTHFIMGTHMTMVDTAQERIFLFVLFQFDNNMSGGNGNCTFTTTAKLYSVYESGNSILLSEIVLTNCWTPDVVAAVPGGGWRKLLSR